MISIFKPNYKYTYKIKHIQALTTPSRQETQHAPSLPRGDATEASVGRGAWQRRTSRPGKGRFETVLPRDHAPESSVSRVAVAEDRRSTGAPERDRFQDGLTRGHAYGIPVAMITVAETRVTSSAAAG